MSLDLRVADVAPVDFFLDLWMRLLTLLGDLGGKLLKVAVIILAAWLLSRFLRLVIRRVIRRVVNAAKLTARVDDTQALERSPLADIRLVQRTRTLGTILQNVGNIVLGVIALILCVNVLMPDLLGSFALVTAAIGAGLGFGAQNIVKDTMNGLFIVAEDQIGIGDVVDLGLASGMVEYVSVRVTQVRDVNGTLWYVRNGEITRIGNMSQGWARVIIDLAVPVNTDIDEVEDVMLQTARAMRADQEWRTRVLEDPEMWGLESVTGDALVIRLVMKTRANAKALVARELRLRLKRAIDNLGITLPPQNAITLAGLDGASRGPAGPIPPANPAGAHTTAQDHPRWRHRDQVPDTEHPSAADPTDSPAKETTDD